MTKTFRGFAEETARRRGIQDVIKHDKDIVTALRAALADKVGTQRFELWFGASTRLELDRDGLTIAAPTKFFLDWIRANFRSQIESACQEILGSCPSLSFRVEGTDQQMVVPLEAVEKPNETLPTAASAESAQPPAEKREPRQTAAPRRKFATLDSFAAGEVNRLALASAKMVADRPGQLTPLLFHGPTGVGKTHLLEGIWSAARKARKLTTVYLSAEQFTTYFLEALRGSGLPNFRRKYRGVDVLVIDDLQFFVGKRTTQIELLHTIDTLLRDGRQLIFAADRAPAELAELGPELTTRLQSGMVCRVEIPDCEARHGIVAGMAQRMSMDVPPVVVQFIATRLTSHAREISGALCRLQATSESIGKPISLAMAEEALADLVRQSGRIVRLGDIQRAVCDVFGLEPEGLQAEAKGPRVSHPRMLAMWLARKHTRAALSEIGQYFGRRSHSTVVSAQKRVAGWMAAGQSVSVASRSLSIDEAIRQVERHLAAG